MGESINWNYDYVYETKTSYTTSDEHGTEVATVFGVHMEVYPIYSLDRRRRGPQNLLHLTFMGPCIVNVFF